VRGTLTSLWLRFFLKGFQKLAGGRRQAHHRSMTQEYTHPEGMPEATNLAPFSGCEPNSMHRPVVALCLPPATFLNRFAVSHKNNKVITKHSNLALAELAHFICR
jgi:hypothetical protein